MANDRIYIRCTQCGDQKLLAKYYPTLFADTFPSDDLGKWMYDHMHPPCRKIAADLQSDPGFDLHTESGGA